MSILCTWTMLGNRVVGVLHESGNKWERRAPLTPSHCARLLHSADRNNRVDRIIVQPCTKRIHSDAQYEEVGCEISEDLSECGLILGIKQPKLENILPDRGYAFFSHTHKAQPENMSLLDKVLNERVSLYDYELIVGDNGKRLLAFGKYAGRAGMVDFLRGLGERLLNLGYSTPFLSLGSSYMYSSLSAAKAAVIAVGEEIAASGLPSAVSPLVVVFTGLGNVSQGAQEILRLLPHTFVEPSKLPELIESTKYGQISSKGSKISRQNFQVYGCVVTSKDMVAPKDSSKNFDKDDYYAHPEHYYPVFHEKIAPYASVIVNCMYWEKRFPRLLNNKQMHDLKLAPNRLVGVADITCDIGGSIECLDRATSIERPFFRYDPLNGSYNEGMNGEGVIFLAVDILPTELAKEATKHFGDVLCQFLGSMASSKGPEDLLPPIRRACITHKGELTPLYNYIKRMREEAAKSLDNVSVGKAYKTLVSLNGHLFDQFLINEALDIIETAGGSFHLARCQVGQSVDAMSYAEIEVSANDKDVLAHIVDMLAVIAKPDNERKKRVIEKEFKLSSSRIRELGDTLQMKENLDEQKTVLIIGAGRVCEPAVEFLAFNGSNVIDTPIKNSSTSSTEEVKGVQVIVASLYLQDAQKVIEGIPNTTAVELDISDYNRLLENISKVDVVISLLPANCHTPVANACIELRKHLVTASYVDKSMSDLNERAKSAGVTILCEMGLDPGIDHMMAMKMINHAHLRGGKIKSFVSYCGGLPSPAAANNPLGYKFSWSPAGALRAGRNPAIYSYKGQTIRVDGESLYDSATSLRIPHLPAFALERLPNRDSLVYGDFYGITNEASTVFRATLRYQGFSEIMSSFSKLGFFNNEFHPMLTQDNEEIPSKTTFSMFLQELLKVASQDRQTQKDLKETQDCTKKPMDIAEMLVRVGCCKDSASANRTASCIKFLGLNDDSKIPNTCKSAFDVICSRMEERLNYSPTEQDMVLLHHELEVTYEDGRPSERLAATLLEFGKTETEKSQTAMARTVGIPAAIGAMLLLEGKIKSTGVLRPLEPEIYLPALEILAASGIHLNEEVENI